MIYDGCLLETVPLWMKENCLDISKFMSVASEYRLIPSPVSDDTLRVSPSTGNYIT